MKANTCDQLTDRTETFTIADFYLEPGSAKKSYAETWQRVKRKIKVYLMLKRFAKSASETGLQIGRPSEILTRFSSLQSLSSRLVKTSRFIITPYKKFYLTWITINAIALLYLSSYGILHYCYYSYFSDSLEAIIEILIDSLFFIDVVLSFNLSYFNKSNNLVKDRKKIALHYLKNFLLIDLLGAIPFGYMLKSNPDREFTKIIMFRHVIKFAKWIKIRKQSKNFSFIRQIDIFLIKFKEICHFFRVILVLSLSVHIISCLFYLSARANNYDDTTWVYRSNLVSCSTSEKYLTSFYWALVSMITLGYGDIHPYTSIEKSIALIWMIVGIFVISYSISKFTVIYQHLSKKYKTIEETLILSEKFASLTKIPDQLNKRLKRSIRDQLIITKRMEANKVLTQIDLELKHEIAMDIYQSAICKIPFFSMKDKNFLAEFVFMLELVQYRGGEYIWLRNSSADGVYFIFFGRIKFVYQDILFYVMREGEFFGDTEIFMKVERKFDAVACEMSKCLKMTKERMNFMREAYPKYYYELKKMRKRRRKNVLDNLTQMIVLHKFYKNDISCVSREIIKRMKKEVFAELFADDPYIIQKFRLSKALKYVKETQIKIRKVKEIIKKLKKEKVLYDNFFIDPND